MGPSSQALSPPPFRLYPREDGDRELVLSDGDMEDVFEGLGTEGNGYGWEGLAEWISRAEMPELAGAVRFDSFVAVSPDPVALRWLAGRLHAAFRDRALLGRLVAGAGAGAGLDRPLWKRRGVRRWRCGYRADDRFRVASAPCAADR